MTKHKRTSARAGIYIIEGPAGIYVGQAVDCLTRSTCLLAERLGLQWGIVRELPGIPLRKRNQIEIEIADSWAARGFRVISQNTTHDIQAFRKKLGAKIGHIVTPATRVKLSAVNKGQYRTKASRKRMRIAQRLRFSNPAKSKNQFN